MIVVPLMTMTITVVELQAAEFQAVEGRLPEAEGEVPEGQEGQEETTTTTMMTTTTLAIAEEDAQAAKRVNSKVIRGHKRQGMMGHEQD